MKKRTTSLLLALVMALALLPAHAWATESVDESDTAEIPQVQTADEAATSGTCGAAGSENSVTWRLAGGVLTISGNGPMADWNGYYNAEYSPWYHNEQIKKIVIGEGVTSIGTFAFDECSEVTEISMPATVTKMGDFALYGCRSLSTIDISHVEEFGARALGNTGLKKVAVPSGIIELQNGVFENCTSLTMVTLPEGLTKIGSIFNGCTSLADIALPSSLKYIGSNAFSNTAIETITIPEGVTEIGEGVFSECPNLTKIVIPDSVVKMGWNAIERCPALKSIHIGKGMSDLDAVYNPYVKPNYYYLFTGCENLTTITVDPGNQYYAAVDNVLFTKDMTKVLRAAPGKTGSYTLPDSVTRMSHSYIFADSRLSSIVIQEGVTYLSRGAFQNCLSLKTIWLPKSLNGTDLGAFQVEKSSCDYVTDPIKDVYYAGSETEWAAIYFGENGRPSGTVHYNSEKPLQPGCPTGGSTVQIQDVAFTYDFLTGQKQGADAVEKDSAQWKAMDVNNDNTVDVYDLQAIYEMAAGLRS